MTYGPLWLREVVVKSIIVALAVPCHLPASVQASERACRALRGDGGRAWRLSAYAEGMKRVSSSAARTSATRSSPSSCGRLKNMLSDRRTLYAPSPVTSDGWFRALQRHGTCLAAFAAWCVDAVLFMMERT